MIENQFEIEFTRLMVGSCFRYATSVRWMISVNLIPVARIQLIRRHMRHIAAMELVAQRL